MKYKFVKVDIEFSKSCEYQDALVDVEDIIKEIINYDFDCLLTNQNIADNRKEYLLIIYNLDYNVIGDMEIDILREVQTEYTPGTYDINYIEENEAIELIKKWFDDIDDIKLKYLYNDNLNKLVTNVFNFNLSDDFKALSAKINKELVNKETDGFMEKLDKLEDSSEFKQYIKELDNMKDILFDYYSKGKILNQHFIFSADYGSEVKDAINLLYEYIKINKLFDAGSSIGYENDFNMGEFALSAVDSITQTIASKFELLKSDILDVEFAVIHIEDWLLKLEDPIFSDFLDFCFRKRNNKYFIFVVPYVDAGTMNRVYSRISDKINVKLIRFKPFTDYQLIKVIKKSIENLNFTYDDNIESYLKKALLIEHNSGKFAGLVTARKIANQLMRNKLRICAKRGITDNIYNIDKLAFEDYFEEDDGRVSGFEELDSLIGLKEVKERIKEIVLSFKNQRKLVENGVLQDKPCFHMMFTGNPGTGKTAVARIIGKIFRENGLIPSGDLFEVNRFDLVGEFIGQTAIKTLGVCKNALGSVMFIDEAYLLGSGSAEKNDADFGAEALGTLIAEMENHRDEFVVIFAGYKEEIEKLYDINAGLRDRIPNRIHFPNYSKEELYQIFELMLSNKFLVEDKLYEKAKEFFLSISNKIIDDKEFGNARFVRNIVERVRLKAYLRLQNEVVDDKKIKLLAIDFEMAINDNDIKAVVNNQQKTIGFNFN